MNNYQMIKDMVDITKNIVKTIEEQVNDLNKDLYEVQWSIHTISVISNQRVATVEMRTIPSSIAKTPGYTKTEFLLTASQAGLAMLPPDRSTPGKKKASQKQIVALEKARAARIAKKNDKTT